MKKEKKFNISPHALSVNEQTARMIEERLAARGDGRMAPSVLISVPAESPKPDIVARLEVVENSQAPAVSEVAESVAPTREANVSGDPATPPVEPRLELIQTPLTLSGELGAGSSPTRENASRSIRVTGEESEDTDLSLSTGVFAPKDGAPSKPSAPRRRAPSPPSRSMPLSLMNRQGTREEPYTRKDGIKTRATTVTLPVELARKLAVHCAETGARQSDIIAAALLKHLK